MSGRCYAVMTALGPDRPGIVKEISSVIHGAGANLEDSRMSILAGEFALLALLSGTAEAVEQVRRKISDLERQLEFSITLKDTSPRPAAPGATTYDLEVTGVDQPGIVSGVTEVLAAHEINVVSLETRLDNAAFSGTKIFTLVAEIEVRDSAAQSLDEKLESVCEPLHMTLTLEPQRT